MREAALMFGISRVASDSFDQVVRQRERQVLRIAYRMLGNWADAEDAAQEVFLRLHRHGLDFPDDAVLGAWLYRVTANLCVDRARSSRPSCVLPELRSGDMAADTALLREEQKQRLMEALAMLPAKERAAVTLREIEELPTVEVAEILGSTEGTVRSQVSKAMTRLRAIMSREKQ
jgi:RNA polymerase sigma-70 factor (ECF subfamily)